MLPFDIEEIEKNTKDGLNDPRAHPADKHPRHAVRGKEVGDRKAGYGAHRSGEKQKPSRRHSADIGMEEVVDLKVKLIVNIEYGKTWYDAK